METRKKLFIMNGLPCACGGTFCTAVMVYVIGSDIRAPISMHSGIVRSFSGTRYTVNSNVGTGAE